MVLVIEIVVVKTVVLPSPLTEVKVEVTAWTVVDSVDDQSPQDMLEDAAGLEVVESALTEVDEVGQAAEEVEAPLTPVLLDRDQSLSKISHIQCHAFPQTYLQVMLLEEGTADVGDVTDGEEAGETSDEELAGGELAGHEDGVAVVGDGDEAGETSEDELAGGELAGHEEAGVVAATDVVLGEEAGLLGEEAGETVVEAAGEDHV